MSAAAVRRWLSAFGRFWWDFLVGDTPEITLGVGAIVAATMLLRHQGVVAVVVLPALGVLLLGLSTLHGRRR